MVFEINRNKCTSVLYGIALMVIAKPQFLSDNETIIAFHSSACVLLSRASLITLIIHKWLNIIIIRLYIFTLNPVFSYQLCVILQFHV